MSFIRFSSERRFHVKWRSRHRPSRTLPLQVEMLESRIVPSGYGPPSALDVTAAGATANSGATSVTQSVSADGRYAVFSSSATDLNVHNFSGMLNGTSEVYLRDLVNGTTTMVSIGSDGASQGSAASDEAVISGNGQYVAFQSGATNLVSGVTSATNQIYIRDLVTNTTILATPGAGAGGDDPSENPSISNDGLTVAFDSGATNLVAGLTTTANTNNVYAYHVGSGTTEMASIATNGTGGGNGSSTAPQLSNDGSTVTFVSNASNLAANATDSNARQDVYARRLSTSSVDPNTSYLVSAEVNTSSPANNISTATGQAISDDGRYEVFTSAATDLIAGLATAGVTNVYLRDRTTGAITLVSAAITDATGKTGGNGASQGAVISGDGRYVAFTSAATNLVTVPSGDSLSNYQLYVWDRTTGTIRLASPADDTATTGNLGGNGNSGFTTNLSISNAALSTGGVVVAFDSWATDLDPAGKLTAIVDFIYGYKVSTGKVQLVEGANANGASEVVSADGTTVAFTSAAGNLDPNATVNTGAQYIYARKLSAPNVVLVSAEVTGTSTGNDTSTATGQAVSGDGRYEVFTSAATDLVSGNDPNNEDNVYLRDRTTGVVTLVSVGLNDPTGKTGGENGTSQDAVISADGRYVAFTSAAIDLVKVPTGDSIRYYQIYVWDRTTGVITLASPSDDTATTGNLGGNYNSGYYVTNLSISNATLSTGGVVVTFNSRASDLDPNASVANNSIDNTYAYNIATGKVQLVSLAASGGGGANASTAAEVVSADGTTVAFTSAANNLDANATVTGSVQNIYARKLSNSHVVLVSIANDGISGANNSASDPVLSSNGQLVAFDSYATNLNSDATNGHSQAYVRNLNSSATTLLSVDTSGIVAATGNTFVTSISSDGTKVALESTSTNLTFGVTTGNQNIYVRTWQGSTPSTVLETPDSAGTDGGNSASSNGVLSADGSTIAFVSAASDLISGTTTAGNYDAYVKPLGAATVLASPGLTGTGGNANADSTNFVSLGINGNAPVVVFDDNASNLVAGDNNGATDVFDFTAGTLGVVSAKPAGIFCPDGWSYDPVISATGQYVAFACTAVDLSSVPRGPNTTAPGGYIQSYVRDLNAATNTLLSVDTTGKHGAAGLTYVTSISADGSKVALESTAEDLTAGVTSFWQNIYVRSWQGSTPTTALESPNSAGTDGGSTNSENGVLSADGSTIAFVSAATDLINGVTVVVHSDVYIKTLGGATMLVSAGLAGTGGNGNADSTNFVSLGMNGSVPVVVFNDAATNLVAGDNIATTEAFDFTAGVVGVVSAKPAGTFSGNGDGNDPVISADGQFVAFDSAASNLTANSTVGQRNVFIRDLNAGTTTLISIDDVGDYNGGNSTSYMPSISGDGSKVAFMSSATNLTPNVESGDYNIYVSYWQAGAPITVLETPNSAGTDGGNNQSMNPVLSNGGSTIAFVSYATNLVTGVTTAGKLDDYIKLLGGPTVLASPGSGSGGNGNGDSTQSPALDFAGDTLVFDSAASNLVTNDFNNTTDVFVVAEPNETTTTTLTDNGISAPTAGGSIEVGNAIGFTVRVTPVSGGPATGAVQVEDATNGNALVGSSQTLTNGAVTFTLTASAADNLGAGIHELVAVYTPTGNFASSTSRQVGQVIDSVFKVQTLGLTSTSNLSQTATGFVVTFNAPVKTTALNLYGAGPPSFTFVTGATSVSGSLVFDPAGTSATFVATGSFPAAGTPLAGLLTAGATYSVDVSGTNSNAFQDSNGNVLGSSTTTGGADFTSTFTSANSGTSVTVSVPYFARGYSQAVNVPASSSNGLPISIDPSPTNPVSSAAFDVFYDPTLLTVTGGAITASGFTGMVNVVTTGRVHIALSGGLLTAGSITDVASLTAFVPSTAPYRDKEVLDIRNISINGRTDIGQDGSAVHAATFLDGTQGPSIPSTYSAQDAFNILKASAGLPGAIYNKLLDPTIVADDAGLGRSSAQDAFDVLKKAVGLSVPLIPDLPAGGSPPSVGGPDPYLYLDPLSNAPVGSTVTVHVNLKSLQPGGFTFDSSDLALSFDPTKLQISNVRAGSYLAVTGLGSSLFVVTNVNNQTGTLFISGFTTNANGVVIPDGTTGDVVQFDVKILSGGATVLKLNANIGNHFTDVNGGQATLSPAPDNSFYNPRTDDLILVGRQSAAPTLVSPGVGSTITEPAIVVGPDAAKQLSAMVFPGWYFTNISFDAHHRTTALRIPNDRRVSEANAFWTWFGSTSSGGAASNLHASAMRSRFGLMQESSNLIGLLEFDINSTNPGIELSSFGHRLAAKRQA